MTVYRLGKTYPVDFNVMNDDHFQSTTVCNGRLEMVINNQGSPRDKFCPEKLCTRAPAIAVLEPHAKVFSTKFGRAVPTYDRF